MKFQNCILINFVTDARRHARTSRKQYAPLTFQSWGHNKKTGIFHPVENNQIYFDKFLCKYCFSSLGCQFPFRFRPRKFRCKYKAQIFFTQK